MNQCLSEDGEEDGGVEERFERTQWVHVFQWGCGDVMKCGDKIKCVSKVYLSKVY